MCSKFDYKVSSLWWNMHHGKFYIGYTITLCLSCISIPDQTYNTHVLSGEARMDLPNLHNLNFMRLINVSIFHTTRLNVAFIRQKPDRRQSEVYCIKGSKDTPGQNIFFLKNIYLCNFLKYLFHKNKAFLKCF